MSEDAGATIDWRQELGKRKHRRNQPQRCLFLLFLSSRFDSQFMCSLCSLERNFMPQSGGNINARKRRLFFCAGRREEAAGNGEHEAGGRDVDGK